MWAEGTGKSTSIGFYVCHIESMAGHDLKDIYQKAIANVEGYKDNSFANTSCMHKF